MFKNNRSLVIIALIAVVNSLGYGIIIPILYSYSMKFGLSDFQNSLLFVLFSLCQFLASPLIGRLSDKFGRKPLLVISLVGTALSFFIAAFAPSALFLFLARGLDGLTAGNIPVASAVISDTTEQKDRAKGFGIIGAAFGFGFVFGPIIAALFVPLGLNVPFIAAGVISLVTVLITVLFLPETNKHIGQVTHGRLFDFNKLLFALKEKSTGNLMLVTFIFNVAFGLFIFSFQPFAVKTLHVSAFLIIVIYILFGIVGLISQSLIIPRAVKKFGEKNALIFCFTVAVISFFSMYLVRDIPLFISIAVLFGFANSFFMPVVQTILSKSVDSKSQGSIMGLNSSYVSLGTIFGPLFGGLLATISIPLPFVLGSILAGVCLFITIRHLKIPQIQDHLL